MFGGSYTGRNQWTTAAAHPPHLRTIIPAVASMGGLAPGAGGIPIDHQFAWGMLTAGKSLSQRFVAEADMYLARLSEAFEAHESFRSLNERLGGPWGLPEEVNAERRPGPSRRSLLSTVRRQGLLPSGTPSRWGPAPCPNERSPEESRSKSGREAEQAAFVTLTPSWGGLPDSKDHCDAPTPGGYRRRPGSDRRKSTTARAMKTADMTPRASRAEATGPLPVGQSASEGPGRRLARSASAARPRKAQ